MFGFHAFLFFQFFLSGEAPQQSKQFHDKHPVTLREVITPREKIAQPGDNIIQRITKTP